MADDKMKPSFTHDSEAAMPPPEKGVVLDMKQTAKDGHMERGLKSRHIQLIALGNNQVSILAYGSIC